MTALALLDRSLFQLYRLSGLIAALLLVTLTGSILLSILARLAGYWIGGVTEFAGYTMAASAFFGMSYAYATHAHIRVKLLLSIMGPTQRRAAEIFGRGAMAYAAVYLAWYLGQLAYVSWLFEERSEGPDRILLWMPQSVTTVGASVFALAAVHLFLRTLIAPGAMVDAEETGFQPTEDGSSRS